MSVKGKVFVHTKDSSGRKIVTTSNQPEVEIQNEVLQVEIENSLSGAKIFTHERKSQLKYKENEQNVPPLMQHNNTEVIFSEPDKIVYNDKVVYNPNSEIPYVVHTRKTVKKEEIPPIIVEIIEEKTLTTLRRKFINNPLMIINDILNEDTDFEDFPITPIFSDFKIVYGADRIDFSQMKLTLFVTKPKAIIYLINTILNVTDSLDEEDIMKSLVFSFEKENSIQTWLHSIQSFNGLNSID